MTEPTSAQDLFKGRHFDQEIIILCVRWYITFKLSFRDLVQMMAERGITLSQPDTLVRSWKSVPNPLHVLEQNLLAAAVIEFRGPAVGVAGDSLSGFKGAVIFQKIRDAGRPE